MATETWRLYFVVRGESEEKAITISSDTVVTDWLTTFLTSHSLKGYANRVSAWKLHSPTPTPDLLPLIRPGRKMEQIATRMELYRCLRDYFEDSPPKDDQGSHIVFESLEPPPPQRPQPSSHFLSLPGATFQFLKDLHTQLWGKRHLKGDITKSRM
ncbi:hypothetical protein BDN72DRAFT_849969 [Pluteus cervinus]|uniref:Uncharacterized protein n=1 Tax=Pluteus cervinus TaxID=181527 RepID=A0ACD3A610_9AGAR|nr:hypothetical protein BDN72DRAFT_849969 [Pluteus cervinus]